MDSDVMYHDRSKTVANQVLTELDCCQMEDNLSADKTDNSSILVENIRSEPFVVNREVLQCVPERSVRTPDFQKSEANILDLNDVDYADASDNEQECTSTSSKKTIVPEADAMTPDEAELLLSSKWVLLTI